MIHGKVLLYYFSIAICVILVSCGDQAIESTRHTLFTLTKPESTNITFENNLPYTEAFNTYTYRNFYNGGGVALGDVNNDGLLDIYFCGNITDNKLYLNKGNWVFEDVTEKAGLACKGVWSTGATFVDINGDNLLDLYVCKAGKPEGDNRYNELFINKGNLQFEEKAKDFGLDIKGLSIHSAFFDYDKDGDLDCYILNNSLRSVGGFDLKKDLRNTPDPEGNKFMQNQNGKFVQIADKAGVYSSNIGYGLGITLSDFNNDNWTDVFISNDFFERDYLYLNNQKGGFDESATKNFASMSMGSMGADVGDMDNDLLPDLFVTEMLPSTLDRKKTKNLYETWDKYSAAVENGYHHQFSRNILQRNIGQGQFLEISRQAGVSATEWSWAALIQDFDNDGLKDLFVSNGLYKDLLDRDYLNFIADDTKIKNAIANKQKVITPLVDSMPSTAIKNAVFHNKGNFQFENVSDSWGFDTPSFSNGSAYGDLDNDGDLDLVINNANMIAHVYKNNTDTATHKSIQFKLKGNQKNTQAIGAKIIIKYGKKQQAIAENYSARGFESSVADKITMGVGNTSMIDTVSIIWPNNRVSTYYNLRANQLHSLSVDDAKSEFKPTQDEEDKVSDHPFDFTHVESRLNVFSRERLLIDMPGYKGPATAVTDLNGDGMEDVFFGGGKNQNSVLYLSNTQGYRRIEDPFTIDVASEKIKATFFDSDGDSDLDLYVAHGGKAFTPYSQELHDALYINDGKGGLQKKPNFTTWPYPVSTGDFDIVDVNGDKLADIIVGEHSKIDLYGKHCDVFILINKGNNIYEMTQPSTMKNLGMITAVKSVDINKDGLKDVVIAGKWMPIMYILNNNNTFKDQKWITIPNTCGLWNTIDVTDLDHDGSQDLICGNEGLNSCYVPKLTMRISDFDNNGTEEQLVTETVDGKDYVIHDNDEMFSQMPILKKKFLKHHQLASSSIVDLFGKENVNSASKVTLDLTKSIIILNSQAGLTIVDLPTELQYSSINAICTFANKQSTDIYCGGNNYRVKPQYGRSDASQGWKITYDQNLNRQKLIPLYIMGEIRYITPYKNNLLVAINNDTPKYIRKK